MRKLSAPYGVVVGLSAGAALTFPAIFLAILSGGMGHGDYFWARLFLPYAMLLASYAHTIGAPSIALAFVQLPVEGALIGLASRRNRGLAACAVGLAHFMAFTMCDGF
jgi:hypothetical protein